MYFHERKIVSVLKRRERGRERKKDIAKQRDERVRRREMKREGGKKRVEKKDINQKRQRDKES